MYVEIRPGDGSAACSGTVARPGEAAPTPRIPKGFAPGERRHRARATVERGKGGARFRLLARSVPFAEHRR